MVQEKVCIFWFRRDLRIDDNTALYYCLKENKNVLPLFIFDTEIIESLNISDLRVQFIYQNLKTINQELNKYSSSIIIKKGKPLNIFKELLSAFQIAAIYYNHDYEPASLQRDIAINDFAREHAIQIKSFKDHVIFEKYDVLKKDKTPYTVFTPYSKQWFDKLTKTDLKSFDVKPFLSNLLKSKGQDIPPYESLGFKSIDFTYPKINLEQVYQYEKHRDYPSIDGTSKISVHLRFGTISIRKAAQWGLKYNKTWLKELVWREFFMMILYHFPYITESAFKKKYNRIEWSNDEHLFNKWSLGLTGYPLVDAGMRELNSTGYMHNRVRMITASFLVKHLLINWQWGESYFAEKLLDYELSSNNGNWQWAAGTGCDAAPYFRIFNPILQAKKFDKDEAYIKKWVPEIHTLRYPKPIIEHEFAKRQCLNAYKKINS